MTTITGPKKPKRLFISTVVWGFGEFFLILPCFFDLLTMFIDSTTKITPHSLANVTWGSFFAQIHTGPKRRFYYRRLGQISIYFIYKHRCIYKYRCIYSYRYIYL